ncbi:putative ABC transporter permease/ATP-binding protein [Gordonia effusa NBRC 100432]|uniref:Putative ABC transporter permease/ATP-binding protein n=1 Tax=Gordonia effusa NBRC 100432 TaxID=1077974 RepID=H0R3S2_9ACTN|nr:ABC transporter ATP-binding protein [Gordonia effusa]GAB19723.1 putative ABC transporter permease/ATP-binding protein [Gordonia effusa NBRC 100432]
MSTPAEKPDDAGIRTLLAITGPGVRGFRWRVTLVLTLSVSLVGSSVVVPYLLGTATDAVIRSLSTGELRGRDLAVPLSGVAVVALISAAISYTRDRQLIKLTEDWDSSVRARIVAILNRSPGGLDEMVPGDLLSRCVNDLDALTRTASMSLSAAATAIVSILGSLAVMLWFDVWFPLVAIGTLIAVAAVGRLLAKRARPYFEQQMQEYGSLTGVVLDAYIGRDVYRSGHNSAGLLTQLADVDEGLSASTFHSTRLAGAAGPASSILESIGFVFVVVIGAFRIASGSLTVGEVQATIQYYRQATNPVGVLTDLLHSLQQAATSARRVLAVLRAGDSAPTEIASGAVELTPGALPVSFDEVFFSYGDDAPVLEGFSMRLAAGSHTALVGPSGAGKSTAIRLLLGLLHPTTGTIQISGQSISGVDRDSLAARVAVVPQVPWVFTGTVTENIRCMRPDVSVERVREVGTRCGLDVYVAALPAGYDTVVSADGRELPGNARRLIGIARAIAGSPGLVLMDEPTAGMDPVSAAGIEALIADQFLDTTVLVVSHRDSTIAALDRAIVLDDGYAVER